MKSILVTGANGFIGKAIVIALCKLGYSVKAAVRSQQAIETLIACKNQHQLNNLALINVGDISEYTDWTAALTGVDKIIHCAARAHILKETQVAPLEVFRRINCIATENLAKQAQAALVKRFIFISSIGVLGSYTTDMPFSESSRAAFDSDYGQAKWEAEQRLSPFSKTMEIVIIRPPLVYGKGVKGNFQKLQRLIEKKRPLPLGSVHNKRQFIGIDNLVDFVLTCTHHPLAANEIFVVADKEVVSTTEFIKYIAAAMQKKPRLIPIPGGLLNKGLILIGKGKIATQLLANLEINTAKAKTTLDWEAPYSMQEQLAKAFMIK